ncbi:MAG: PD-(D/E)XK nuclease family protein [Candidatus Hydrogenedentota bacterium]
MNRIELKSVSASKIKLYLSCPRRYYYVYSEGIFEKDTKEKDFGTYIHSVIEDYLKCLIKKREKKDLELLYSIAKNKRKGFENLKEDGHLSFSEADLLLNRFALQSINPETIYAIEKFFKLPIEGNMNIEIEGRIDRIDVEYRKDSNHLLHIIDYKTGKNKISDEELKDDLQMKTYITAAYLMFRKRYKRFRFTLYYLRDNSISSYESDYLDDYQKEIVQYAQKMKDDTLYEKKINQQCHQCPAFSLCKPFI